MRPLPAAPVRHRALERAFGRPLGRVLVCLLALLAAAGPALAQVCGTPGKDGPGGVLTGVVNTYWPGTTAAAGATTLTAGAALSAAAGGAQIAAAPGDLLLVIQVQDATINAVNSNRYGDGNQGTAGSGANSYNTSGQYEYVVVTGTTSLGTAGGSVTIRGAGTGGGFLNTYSNTTGTTTPRKRFQVVRVPQYSSATLSSGLTAAGWNGLAGGVLAVDVAGQLALGGAAVSVTGKGFRGGGGRRLTGAASGAASGDYVTASTVTAHGSKGEGVAGAPRFTAEGTTPTVADGGADAYPTGGMAQGAPGNAGGGGNDGLPTSNSQNSGGGGGSGAGAGGKGGFTWTSSLDVGGRGGAAFPFASSAAGAKAILGGGGGAGASNDGSGTPGLGAASSGAAGGGVVLLRVGSVTGTGSVTANGASANSTVLGDGSGGGGGGGTVVVVAGSGTLAGLSLSARGGTGGTNTGAGAPHGPGGGGGGGYIVTSAAGATTDVTGGAAGTTSGGGVFGAVAGTSGAVATATAALPGALASATCVPTLTVTKTTSTASVTAGNSATYTITVTAGGTAAGRDTARAVTVLDTLPAGMTFVSGTAATASGASRPGTAVNPAAGATVLNFGTFNLPGTGTVTITVTAGVALDAAPGLRNNSAYASYLSPTRATTTELATPRYDGAAGTTENVTVVGVPNLRVTKAHVGDFLVNRAGSYTLTASNAGTASTSGTVTLTDNLPAGLTYNAFAGTGWTCSASGQVVTCTSTAAIATGASASAVTLTVTPTAAAAAAVTNTAQVSGGGEPAAHGGDNSASDPTNVTRVDLALALTDSARTFVVGQPGFYTLVVNNAGTAPTQAATTVSAALPAGLTVAAASGAGWTCSGAGTQSGSCTRGDTLAAGAAWPAIRLQVAVAAGAVPSVTVTGSAATQYDAVAGNHAPSEATPVITVGVTVTPDGGAALDRLPSNGVQYAQAYTVTNNGNASDTFTLTAARAPGASTAVVSTNGTGGAAGTVTLAAGASATVTVVYTVPANAATGATDTLRLTAASGHAPAVQDPGHAVVRVVRAGLVLVKQAFRDDRVTPIGPADRVVPGEYVQYRVTATSNGTAGAVTVRVSDPLPAELAYVAATPDAAGWTISAAGGTLTAELAGALAAGQSRFFWLRARVR